LSLRDTEDLDLQTSAHNPAQANDEGDKQKAFVLLARKTSHLIVPGGHAVDRGIAVQQRQSPAEISENASVVLLDKLSAELFLTNSNSDAAKPVLALLEKGCIPENIWGNV